MKRTKLSEQIKNNNEKPIERKPKYDGTNETISTGSTLLDLAISGGRFPEGGIPLGILIEVFGPASSGKTVLLSEMAGNIQSLDGSVMFHDPEARLNTQFAQLFGLQIDDVDYTIPNTIPEVFETIRGWEPSAKPSGIFCDSLAALSTDMEMDNTSGDKMGMRRAKEFSEELRKTCRIIQNKNYLLVCSNQVRVNIDAGPYGQKYSSPGGESIGFYSSLRLRFKNPKKEKEKKTINGKEVERIIGSKAEIEIYKSSIWKPFRTAPVTILFDYGIDDIRENLQFIKDYTKNTVYCVGDEKLSNKMEEAIDIIEGNVELQKQLKQEVIDLWNEIENKFKKERKPKK